LSFLGTHSSNNTRTGYLTCLGLFQHSFYTLARYTGEVVQKFLESSAGLEVVKQRLTRHPSTPEDWGAAEDLWVAIEYAKTGLHKNG
jgi:hypothetical protein